MFDLLLHAWNLYRKNFLSLALIQVAVWVPCELIPSWIDSHLIRAVNGRHGFQLEFSMNFFFAVIATAGMFFFLSERQNKRKVSALSALRAALGLWSPIFFTSMLVFSGVLLGTLLLILPGIYLAVRVSLAEVLVVTDKISGIEAIQESFALTRKKFWMLLGIYTLGVLPSVITYLLIFGVEIFVPTPEEWIANAVQSLLVDFANIYMLTVLFTARQRLQR